MLDDSYIDIDLSRQQLILVSAGQTVEKYSVSTALNGAGEQINSGCTPRGKHKIKIKIGDSCPPQTVFVGRRTTGEIYTPQLAAQNPQRDWILTRIIWLTGCESGTNRGPGVDTLHRYIYIHGTPDSEPMGTAASHGCVRMRNADIIDLFEKVHNGMHVLIRE